MLYRFDESKLRYEPVNLKPFFIFSVIFDIVLAFAFYNLGGTTVEPDVVVEEVPCVQIEKVQVIPAGTEIPFSKDALIQMLNDLNVKYPHIVLAQSILETGHFKSEVFLQNNNLFGMKEARVRQHTADGTNLGHACYNTWQESVIDYALYQARYLSHIKSEDEYIQYLNERYAEAKNYDTAVLGLIDRLSLKDIFA